MATSDYTSFLANKRRRLDNVGIIVDPGELHESLFGFQREVACWALAKGRCAIFADTGLGKTRMQIEWARHAGARSLIVAPLSVARQTVREAAAIDVEVRYVRDESDAAGPGVWITNYEMVNRFDPRGFDAVVLDESSILKNVAGKIREYLTAQFIAVPHRLACTATPAPNDVAELCNHAEFLSVMPRSEMLAAFFIHDDVGWRLKGHAAEPMYAFIAEWAKAFRRPSDMGYPDEGYDLPPLKIHSEIATVDVESPGQLFATDLGGVSGRATVRRATMDARVERAVELASSKDQWIIWCGMNAESDAMARAIPDSVNVEGSWTPEAKAEALEAFQDGEVRVLITKPSIAGFGMNFQNCHKMAFLGLSDSYESYYQSIRRCWRFGQKYPVDAHVIVSELEQQIVSNVRAKEVESSKLTDALVRHLKREMVPA
jgi:superfamily II DNA or RNA helicase